MGKITTGFSMSLDGFVAGPNDDITQVFAWFGKGDTDYKMPGAEWAFKVSAASAAVMGEAAKTAGALVTARRTFDLTNAWNGRHPLDVPMFVVTHTPVQEWIKEGSPFTFVTDGVESAVAQARQAAGDKNVVIGTPSLVQQCLNLGLLDEIHVDLVPVVLGEGVPLFAHLNSTPIELENTRVVEGTGVTHLTYRVVK